MGSIKTAQSANDPRMLLSARAYRSTFLRPATALLLTSGTAYGIFIGRMPTAQIWDYVGLVVTVAGAGAQTAEVGFFSSPDQPNNANQTLTKLGATGTIGALTATGIIKNTAALACSVPAATYLWAVFRVAMATTQPTVVALGNDFASGNILTLAGASALTSITTIAGVVPTDAGGSLAPDLTVMR